MYINKYFIIVVIILLIFWWLVHPQPIREGFHNFDRIHLMVDGDGEPINWNYQSPNQDGINGCAMVHCGAGYMDDIVCWRCCNYH